MISIDHKNCYCTILKKIPVELYVLPQMFLTSHDFKLVSDNVGETFLFLTNVFRNKYTKTFPLIIRVIGTRKCLNRTCFQRFLTSSSTHAAASTSTHAHTSSATSAEVATDIGPSSCPELTVFILF